MAAALLIGFVDRRSRQAAYGEARAVAVNDAAILSAGLQAELDKFSLVPLVLAEDATVRDALFASQGSAAELNRRFETLAKQTNAAAIYLMDRRGRTVAASNWRLPTSFVGSDYSFRDYFREASASGSATQFALGTVSRTPGLYIAQRVEAGGRPLGIVAVKVEFQELEESWRRIGAGVFVTDPSGVVLITSRQGWRFNTTRPEAAPARDRGDDVQQFGISDLPPLPLAEFGPEAPVDAPLVDADQPINFNGWRLHLLIDPTSEVRGAVARARFYALAALVALIGLVAFAFVLRRRREVVAQRLIERRTQDLREQLGQANRLAILGQVTAGIGHEINQPVAAVQIYAENGTKLIERHDYTEAKANFRHIVDLTGRIGRITTELRGFARRGSAEPEIFAIGSAIDGALLLLHDRLERCGATLHLPEPAETALTVRAEPVRLEQVLVNLLQNAIDAVGRGGSISLAIEPHENHCLLRVRDDGPGVSGKEDQLFQPFATTKPDGLGLGLVISREIMRALGGELTVERVETGASFLMKIPRG